MSQSYDRLSVYGLYTFDNTLFDELQVPSGMEKAEVVDNIIMEAAELEVYYSNFDFLKSAIGTWSKSRLDSWTRIKNALEAQYNPIENFDRYEDSSDTRLTENSNKQTNSNSNNVHTAVSNLNERTDSANSTNVSNNGETITNEVNGFNTSEGLAVHDKTTRNVGNNDSTHNDVNSVTQDTNSSDTTGSGASVSDNIGSGKEDNAHVAHLHGNIGVTTNQQMVEAELKLRIANDITSIIVNDFIRKFCLRVY